MCATNGPASPRSSATPVFPGGGDEGNDPAGLCYALMGGGVFQIKSLREYCLQAGLEDVSFVLEKRLFRMMEQRMLRPARNVFEFPLRSSYDALLPVNLLVEPISETGFFPENRVSDHFVMVRPDTLPPPSLQPGTLVRLEGFIITEVDPRHGAVTLNVPPGEPSHAYRLRLQPVENLAAYRVGQVMPPAEGVVGETRHSRLEDELAQALGPAFDPACETVSLPEGIVLPNPLLAIPAILGESRHVKVNFIHGDLNLENVLVDPQVRDVRLIDFAGARQDHVLHDFLHLGMGVVTELLPAALAEAQLPPQAIYSFYEQLHCATFQSGQGGAHRLLHPALERPFAILSIIRQAARAGLYDPDDFSEYYQGLTLYLLSALKFTDLNPTAKQVAFLGAATALDLLDKPPSRPRGAGAAILDLALARLKRPAWLVGALVAILLLVVAAFVFRFAVLGTPGRPAGRPAVASIISLQPEVDVKRAGTDRLTPATFSLHLYPGDVVITYVGASVTVICENGILFSLPEQNNLTVDCQDTTDARILGRLDPALGALSVSETMPLVLASERSPAPRTEQAQLPLLLSPRNTTITDTRPSFRWQPVPGASRYRFALGLPGGETWSRETTATRLSYPSDVPPLEPGSANVVTVAAWGDTAGEAAVDKTLLQVLDRADLADLNRAEAEVRALELDEAARSYLLAQLYRGRGLRAAAIAQLEWLVDQGIVSAGLWGQLGDLYFQAGLYPRAEDGYRGALTAAQAAAHVGLARAAHAFEEIGQALEHLQTAEALYRQAGETWWARQVEAEWRKLKG